MEKTSPQKDVEVSPTNYFSDDAPLPEQKGRDALLNSSSLNRRCFLIFFFLGALNNLSYEIICCFSNDLAKEFHEEQFMSVFSGCLVLFGVLARFANSKFLLKVRHRTKNYSVIGFFVLGVAIMLMAKYFEVFALSLVGTVLLGIGTSLGDSNDIGFMKGLPPIVANGHSAGTGLSGIIGSTFYLLLKVFNFSYYAVIGSMLLFLPFYGWCFHLAVRFKQQWNSVQLQNQSHRLLRSDKLSERDSDQRPLGSQDHQETAEELELEINAIEDQESRVNDNLTWANTRAVWPLARSYILGYFVLYLLEYVANSWVMSQIISEFTEQYGPRHQPFYIEYGFELAFVVYRVMLFAGRSSLSFFKCRHFWVLIVVLLLADAFFFAQSVAGTVFTLYTMYANIVLIAFVGGVAFCNIIYISLENERLKRSEKELTLNMLTIFGDLGILVSSVIGLIVPKLVYK